MTGVFTNYTKTKKVFGYKKFKFFRCKKLVFLSEKAKILREFIETSYFLKIKLLYGEIGWM